MNWHKSASRSQAQLLAEMLSRTSMVDGFSLLAFTQELFSVQLQSACQAVEDRLWSMQTGDLKANLNALENACVRTTAKLVHRHFYPCGCDLHSCTITIVQNSVSKPSFVQRNG